MDKFEEVLFPVNTVHSINMCRTDGKGWLKHCTANFQVVGLNSAYMCLC